MFPTEFEMAVLWIGALALVSILSLAAALAGLFLAQAVARWRRERVLGCWRPLFMACLRDEVTNWPDLSGSAAADVLELWRHLHDALGDEQKRQLEHSALKVGLPRFAIFLLRSVSDRNVCLGAEVSGRLKLSSAWDGLAGLLTHSAAEVSAAAAIALCRIDARRAAPALMTMLTGSSRWQPVFGRAVAASLQGVDSSVQQCAKLPDTVFDPRQLEILATISPEHACTLLNKIFDDFSSDDRHINDPGRDELLSAALRLLKSTSLLEKTYPFTRHPQWFVRVQAANAIGRLGSQTDAPLLMPLLSDGAWWVRYRSSQALAGLLGPDWAGMEQIRSNQADPFARDMLRQVMAEIALSSKGREP